MALTSSYVRLNLFRLCPKGSSLVRCWFGPKALRWAGAEISGTWLLEQKKEFENFSVSVALPKLSSSKLLSPKLLSPMLLSLQKLLSSKANSCLIDQLCQLAVAAFRPHSSSNGSRRGWGRGRWRKGSPSALTSARQHKQI